jgi:1,2-diacylglycerol 3-alpha-glucosyltransferase
MNDRRLNVALVMGAPFPTLHGSQMLVRQLAEGLADRGHNVHLVAYAAESKAIPRGVRVHRLPQVWGCRITRSGPHPGKLLLDVLLTARLLGIVRRERIDVLHGHNYEGVLVSLLVGRLTGHPVIYHGHSAMETELPTYFSTALARAAARQVGGWLDANVPRRADYCIGVTENLVDMLRARGVGADDVRYVLPAGPAENTGDPEGAAALRDLGVSDGPTVLYAGNLDRYQNLEFLLKSFARVRSVRPDVRLLMVTHGESRRERRRARALTEEGVHIIRVRTFPETRALIAAADIAVSPRTEATGFPMKLLNYMAAGKPIVACAGSAKMLRDGETGLVVPNGDDGAFARAVLRLLDEPVARDRMGTRARHAVRTLCAPEAMIDRIESVYRRVLAQREAAGAAGPTPSEVSL